MPTSLPLLFQDEFLNEGYGTEAVVPGGFPPSLPDLYRLSWAVRNSVRGRTSRATLTVVQSWRPLWKRGARAVRLLQEQARFRYVGGSRPRFAIANYLAESAPHPKICIDLPGYGDFCFRYSTYLARLLRSRTAAVDAPSRSAGARVNIIYCADDLSDSSLSARSTWRGPRSERIAEARERIRSLPRTQAVGRVLPPNCTPAAWLIMFRGRVRGHRTDRA